MRNLKVAAIQMRCEPLRTMENLAHAERFIEQAASQGAELVLLPELMPGGYLLTEEIWSTAEPFNGTSVAWLKRVAKHYGIYLSMSFAEADGTDFYRCGPRAAGHSSPPADFRRRIQVSLGFRRWRMGMEC